MAENTDRGVLIEFDYTAIDGALLLHEAAAKIFGGFGIADKFGKMAEARYFSGKPYVAGAAAFLSSVKSKRTAEKTATCIGDELDKSLAAAMPAVAAASETRNFFKTIAASGAKIIVITQTDPAVLCEKVGMERGDNFVIHRDKSTVYGGGRPEIWRGICAKNHLSPLRSLIVVGGTASLKGAIARGFATAAVVHEHVAYGDFGGADIVTSKMDTALARKILSVLRL